ncbi:hypothetical protein Golax_021411 [Gossypium laxum]|uniref:VQ domain-containing protein n=1 Tax=Gossypium laxum TaxID=34288 RepID=A0A7J9AMW3_9ROSI|nr:hypothetical protein [Gossypium laxum]
MDLHFPKRQLQIQGPRPNPLRLSKDSHKVKKPPHPPPRAAVPPAVQHRREPVVIYAVSPKVIHAEQSDFMSVVQRYTGLSSESFSSGGAISPAARMAVTEKASLTPRERVVEVGVFGEGGMEEGLIRIPPGILSPAPEALPAVETGRIFSPASEARMMTVLNDWSPMFYGSGLMASPSSILLSESLISSPTLSSDFFTQIWKL